LTQGDLGLNIPRQGTCSTVTGAGCTATEFTHLISQIFPGAGNMPIARFENFNSGDLPNPCPAGQ
jgi:hypothetical protein